MVVNTPDDANIHPTRRTRLTDDPSLARAQLYLYACGVDDRAMDAMTRQLQAVADPDASQELRTQLLIERAMMIGRAALDDMSQPQILPPAHHRQEVHRQELGKPVAALRPGWWGAPWRKLWRNWKQRGRDD